MEIPEGFVPYEASNFAVHYGPVYFPSDENDPTLGLRALPDHANTMEGVHGGVILALCDTALGRLVRKVIPANAVAVTVDLHASFLLGARIGQWIEVHPSIDRVGRSMAFANGLVTADGTVIARVSASFFVHHRPNSKTEERV